jgi:hypothetical protein
MPLFLPESAFPNVRFPATLQRKERMTKRLIALLATLLLLAFAAAGCGDDDGSDRSGADGRTGTEELKDKGAPSKAGTDAGRDEEAESPESASRRKKDGARDANGAKAPGKGIGREPIGPAEECAQRVRGATQLSSDSRSRLAALCEKARSGGPADVERAAREVCETIVRESIPEGSPKHDAFLRACAEQDGP